ncbi:hypothetical protein D3C72_770040 [compost metagenome]
MHLQPRRLSGNKRAGKRRSVRVHVNRAIGLQARTRPRSQYAAHVRGERARRQILPGHRHVGGRIQDHIGKGRHRARRHQRCARTRQQGATRQGLAVRRQRQVLSGNQPQRPLGRCRSARHGQGAASLDRRASVAAHGARDRRVALRLDTCLVRRFQLRQRADTHIVLRNQIQRAIRAHLAVDNGIALGAKLRIALGYQHTIDRKVATRPRLDVLPLQLAAGTQQQIIAALQVQRAAVGQGIALHAQIVRSGQRHAAFGQGRTRHGQILARVQRHRAVGLQMRAACRGQGLTRCHIQRACGVKLVADAGIARGLQRQGLQRTDLTRHVQVAIRLCTRGPRRRHARQGAHGQVTTRAQVQAAYTGGQCPVHRQRAHRGQRHIAIAAPRAGQAHIVAGYRPRCAFRFPLRRLAHAEIARGNQRHVTACQRGAVHARIAASSQFDTAA